MIDACSVQYVLVQVSAWWWQCGLGEASRSCFYLKPGSPPSHGTKSSSDSLLKLPKGNIKKNFNKESELDFVPWDGGEPGLR